MLKLSRRHWIQTAATGTALACLSDDIPAHADHKQDVTDATSKGIAFLASLLDAELDLLPEYRGSNVYWLFHDNYLAAKVLKSTHPEIAKRIDSAMRRHGIVRSGKIEILFNEADKPLPFRRYKLIDVKQIGNKKLKTEILEDELLEGWQEYADLQLLSAVALPEAEPDEAKQRLESAVAMWDGHGFNDRAAKSSGQYATYKLAMGLVAAAKLKTTPPIQAAVLEKLLTLQADDGGWITDYDAKDQPLGVANVETTSLAILGLTRFAAAQ